MSLSSRSTSDLSERVKDLVGLRSPTDLARRLDPTFVTRPHSELIARAFQEIAAGTADRILVATPPQVGKSTTAAVWGPMWWLARNPRHRVIVASYGADLAEKRGKAVRSLIGEHGRRFGMVMERGSTSAADWSMTSGGGMRCVGIDGGLTGHGAHIAIIDDPHKDRAEANSARMRNRVGDWWSSTLQSRTAPGAPIIVVMTLWHPDDLAGRVIDHEGDRADGGRWLVLKCPAFATSENDPLGRAIGEPLPHPLILPGDVAALRAHWEDKKRGASVRDWHALYMCSPQPAEGALLTYAIMRERRHFTGHPRALIRAVSVDPSGGGRSTAGIVGGFLGADQRIYVTHDVTGVMTDAQWARAACELAMRIEADRIICETNFGGTMGMTIIRTAWDALRREWAETHGPDAENAYGLCPRLERASAKGNKTIRAEPVAQQVIEDRVRFGAYVPDVEEEWATWQPDDPDSPGRVDAMVHLVYKLLRPPTAGKRKGSAAAVSRENVAPAPGGVAGRRIRRR